jgi:hypothetical protein
MLRLKGLKGRLTKERVLLLLPFYLIVYLYYINC